MSAKKYVMSLSAVLLMFMSVNIVFWNAFTRKIFDGRDLSRMGSFAAAPADSGNMTYPQKHTEFAEYIRRGVKESFDVISIGDSFTNGGGGNYYQDYLESEYGLKVLNFRMKSNCLIDLYLLIESGLLDEISPGCVILEIVERGTQKSFGNGIIPSVHMDRDSIIASTLKNSDRREVITGYFAPVLIRVNMKYIHNRLYNFLNPERLSSGVYITELDRGMFTNKGQENLLLYYHDDMNFVKSPLNPEILSRNLSNAADILSKKGIKMIFFVAPDKYDLYYPYIKHREGKPENKFFDGLRKIKPEGYVIIDTLSILRSALERGEKDIYWLNDTHWSYKGIKIVCDEIAKYLLPPKIE